MEIKNNCLGLCVYNCRSQQVHITPFMDPPSLLLNYAPAAFHMGTGTSDSSAWKQAVKQDQEKQKHVIGYAEKQGARPHSRR